MTNFLRIDASSRINDSHSRKLGDYFVEQWLALHPTSHIVKRDLITQPIEQIKQTTIAGFYTPAEELTLKLKSATALSDQLIQELQTADALLITAPMYNFSVPAALKAWIDQVVRIGHTFSYDGRTFGGLVNADRAYVICAYGAAGYVGSGAFASANFLAPYLQFLLNFLGVPEVHIVSLEATTGDEQTVEAAITQAKRDIDALIA